MGGSSARGARVEIGEFGQGRDPGAELAQRGDRMFFERVPQAGQLSERNAEGDQVARIAAALDQTRDEALEVANLAQAFLKDIALGLIGAGPGDDTLTALNRGEVAKGREEPLAQEASAAGGDGAIDRGEQRDVFRARAQRIDQFEVPAGGGVEDEDILALPETEGVNMTERAAQFVAEVMQQAAGRAKRAMTGLLLPAGGGEAEAVERRGLEVIAEGVLGGFRRETPGVVLDE